ncbi:Tn3 family transposase [Embleya scabrispora]|uniref:Tn3 family transposase n=1 Tax=Embleya scabrispora TaxID=159449 RepID=UPI0004772E64
MWEAVYLLDSLLSNVSDTQPDTVHADTQGASLPVFGLAALLGFDLLPRIRNWHDLNFYRPDAKVRYKHIDSLFDDSVIDWALIERRWKDLLRTGISIREGRLSSVTLLRRLGNHSKRNRIYKALRELGRVVRTVTLLRYLSEPELRVRITAITNRTEAFHGFATHLMIGGRLIGHNDPDYQESRQIQRADRQLCDLLHRAGHYRCRQRLRRRGPSRGPRRPGHRQPADHAHHTPLRRLALGPHPAQGRRRHQVGSGPRNAVSHRAGITPGGLARLNG